MSNEEKVEEASLEVANAYVSRDEATLQRHLRRWIIDLPADEGEDPCKLIVLYRTGLERRLARIESWRVKPGENIAQLAHAVYDRAADVANGARDTIRFEVSPLFGSSIIPTRMHNFTISGTREDDPELSSSAGLDEVSPRGLLAVAMRGMSDKDKIYTKAIMAAMDLLLRQNDSLSARITEQDSTINRMYKSQEDMRIRHEKTLSEENDRILNRVQVQAVLEMKKEAMKTAMLVLPLILNKVMGKKILPEPKTAQQIGIQELVASLKGEQIEALQTILTPAQQMNFFQLIEQMAQEEEKERVKAENASKVEMELRIRKEQEGPKSPDMGGA